MIPFVFLPNFVGPGPFLEQQSRYQRQKSVSKAAFLAQMVLFLQKNSGTTLQICTE